MKEKIKVKVAEVNVWAQLEGYLDGLERSDRRYMEEYLEALNEAYPDASDEEARREDWRNGHIADIRAKLTAYESIRAVILKAIG